MYNCTMRSKNNLLRQLRKKPRRRRKHHTRGTGKLLLEKSSITQIPPSSAVLLYVLPQKERKRERLSMSKYCDHELGKQDKILFLLFIINLKVYND